MHHISVKIYSFRNDDIAPYFKEYYLPLPISFPNLTSDGDMRHCLRFSDNSIDSNPTENKVSYYHQRHTIMNAEYYVGLSYESVIFSHF